MLYSLGLFAYLGTAAAASCDKLHYAVERVPTLPTSVAQRISLRLDVTAVASVAITSVVGSDGAGRHHEAATAALPTLTPGSASFVELIALRPAQVRGSRLSLATSRLLFNVYQCLADSSLLLICPPPPHEPPPPPTPYPRSLHPPPTYRTTTLPSPLMTPAARSIWTFPPHRSATSRSARRVALSSAGQRSHFPPLERFHPPSL